MQRRNRSLRRTSNQTGEKHAGIARDTGRAPGRLAREGIALTLGREEAARPYIERGERVSVLDDYFRPFPGFYLYDPARRQTSSALRALIDYLLRLRQGQPPAA